MTKRQRDYKKALLKAVHTSKMYKDVYANDRELYEEMLKNFFGVNSSKDLSIDELKRLIKFLNHKEQNIQKEYITPNQKGYIAVMWSKKSLFKDEKSLLKFAKRILKKEVKDIAEITKREAMKLIVAINNLALYKSANNTNFKAKKDVLP